MRKLVTTFTFVMATLIGWSQAQKYIANDLMAEHRYAEAITYYEKALAKKPNTSSLVGLAECYEVIRDYPKAELWYKQAFMADKTNADVVFSYGKMLKANGKYAEAQSAFEIYKQLRPADIRIAEEQIEGSRLAGVWSEQEPAYILSNLAQINSPYSDFGLTVSPDSTKSMFFTSNRKWNMEQNELSSEVAKPYFNILGAKLGTEEENFAQVYPSDIVNKFPYHIATPSYSPSGDTVFFTQTKVSKKEKEILNQLKIYYAVRQYNEWSEPIAFIHNREGASTAHPWLAEDGSALYFISDVKGGLGGYDIYKSEIINGLFNPPVNLGPAINTKEDEFYPVMQNGKLFFSSAGHTGIGGLDVFVSEQKNKTFSAPKNMEMPINSAQDDFAFLLVPETGGKKAYLSSNRLGGKGSDDIYYVELIEELPMAEFFTIQPVNEKGEFIRYNEGEIKVSSNVGTPSTYDHTNNETYYVKEDGKQYTVNVNKPGYFVEDIEIDFANLTIIDTILIKDGNPRQYAYIAAIEIKPKSVINGSEFKINNIYFDYDQAKVRPEAKPELNKLADMLKNTNGVKVEIGSHCDSRGNDDYNLSLSKKRAKSVMEYLISQGVSKNSITYQGYGESEILNNCKNGVECSEQQHEENRRTTFKVK